MEKIISCCGVVCSDCEYYPEDCKGCREIEGKVFWLQFTGGDICDIYDFCIEKKQLAHCGKCSALPCEHYAKNDPTKPEEENKAILKKQLEQLKQL